VRNSNRMLVSPSWPVAVSRALPAHAGSLLLRAITLCLRATGRTYERRTYFGARMMLDPADAIQARVLHFGHWEPTISKVIEATLRPGDTFVDVGANVGYDTLLGSIKVGDTGRVVAIEANPATFAKLNANLKSNDVGNVRAINVAAADRAGTVTLYDSGPRNIGAVTTLASRGMPAFAEVAAMPLSDILSADEARTVRLIKIDVEGAEPPILAALLDRLEDYPEASVLVEASPVDGRSVWLSLFERFRSAGFHAYEVENDYSIEWYLKWRQPGPLRLLSALPESQSDILFTRFPVSDFRRSGLQMIS